METKTSADHARDAVAKNQQQRIQQATDYYINSARATREYKEKLEKLLADIDKENADLAEIIKTLPVAKPPTA